MKTMIFLIAFLAVHGAGSQNPGGDKKNSKLQYRLPNSTVPTWYKIDLVVTGNYPTFDSLSGTVTITIRAMEDTNTVKLHAGENITIHSVALNSETGGVIQLEGTGYLFDNVTEILTVPIKSGTTLKSGEVYQLKIVYETIFNKYETWGPFEVKYKEAGIEKSFIATHFEATFARRAFPCYDEPKFRTKFDVSINYHHRWTALFNTHCVDKINEGNHRVTDIFATTPLMPTYLISFVISEFRSTVSEQNNVWSRKQVVGKTEFMADVAPRVLATMEGLTKVTCTDLGLMKMQEVILKDFSAGGMENFGLVALQESSALADNEATTKYNKTAAVLVAHELSHQWFGNYVGLRWWSDLWLKEAFGTYFGYYIVDKVIENFQMEYQYVPEQMHAILATDASSDAQPVSVDEDTINSLEDIVTRFGEVSYNKGGSLIRMLRHILGDENFELGLQNYLKTFKFETVTGEDLWKAIDATNPNIDYSIAEIMDNWINRPGYPVVNVLVNNRDVTFAQERFLLENATGDATAWYVPISYTTSCEIDFINTKPRLWLTPQNISKTIQLASEGDWIIVNLQEGGYYRVNYDTTTWLKLARVLYQNSSEIHVLNRAQLVDDVMNFAQNGKVTYKTAFSVVKFLENDVDYIPWKTAINTFTVILKRIQNSDLGDTVVNKLRNLMENIYRTVQDYSIQRDDPVYYLKQELIWKWACKLGNRECIAKSQRMFRRMRQNHHTVVPVNLKPAVLCTAIRTSHDSDDWFYLWRKYLHSDSPADKRTILDALSCTKNDPLVTYLGRSSQVRSGPYQLNLCIKGDCGWDYCEREDVFSVSSLWRKYLHSDSPAEKRTILDALGCTKNASLLRYLQDAYFEVPRPISTKDLTRVVESIASENPDGVNKILIYIRDSVPLKSSPYPYSDVLSTIQSYLSTDEQIEILQSVLNQGESLDSEAKESITQAMQTATSNKEWLQRYYRELQEGLNQ